MKKIYFTLAFLLCALFVNAQFFTPVDKVVREKLHRQSFMLTEQTGNVWLIRPSVSLTAVAIQFGEKTEVLALNSVGTGISYGKFTLIDGKSYCNFSVNAALLTQVILNEETSLNMGGAIVADVFNKAIGFGVGYLDKHVMLLTTLSYSF